GRPLERLLVLRDGRAFQAGGRRSRRHPPGGRRSARQGEKGHDVPRCGRQGGQGEARRSKEVRSESDRRDRARGASSGRVAGRSSLVSDVLARWAAGGLSAVAGIVLTVYAAFAERTGPARCPVGMVQAGPRCCGADQRYEGGRCTGRPRTCAETQVVTATG